MTISTILNLLVLGFTFTSIFSITATNSVISVIFLITTFVQVAIYLILIGINFIAISYIVIYVGAIAVLFLFVIMMLNIKLSDILETGSAYTRNLPLALCVGGLFIYEFFTILPFTFNNVSSITALLDLFTNLNGLLLSSDLSSLSTVYLTYSPVIADTAFTNFLQIESIGQGLYTYGASLLIVLSLILLLSMIAPLYISGNKSKNSNPFSNKNIYNKGISNKVFKSNKKSNKKRVFYFFH